VENLCYKIELLRHRMHVTALEKGISHPEVLMISQKLDKVINEFCKRSLIKRTPRNDDKSVAQLKYKLHLCSPARKYQMNRICRMIGQAVMNL